MFDCFPRGEQSEDEVCMSLCALLHLLQSEEIRIMVLTVPDASLVELCRDLISGLSNAIRLSCTTVGAASSPACCLSFLIVFIPVVAVLLQ